MKRIQSLVILSLLLVLPGPLGAEGLGGLHISYLEGDVQFAPADGTDWLPASLNMPLQKGDRLWAPEEARLELQFASGTVVRLDRESALDILALDKASAQLYLAQGRAYLNFWNVAEGSLELFTPLAAARALNRSVFRADVMDDGTTVIAVLKGVADVDSRSETTTVSAGKAITISESGYADVASLGAPDAWEEWNRERDARFSGEGEGESYQYLPDDLRPYADDLDEYGRWTYVEGYDHVWLPGGVSDPDWAPYRVGRWVWVGSDYVWVSYEPWGWVPYHYGRWVYLTAIGWCWVPPIAGAVYWGPGYVSWVYTSTYVAWVPLAPGDIYYGYGQYGPSSVNITNITVYNAPKKVAYKNVHARNAVTVISRDAFLSGRGRTVTLKDNPFLRERTGRGRPAWKPEKATRVPVIKEIPQRRLPPQRFREITAKDALRERPASPRRTQPALQRPEEGPRVFVPAERGGRPAVVPREPQQRPAVQTPFTKRPQETPRSIRESMEEQEKARVQRKPAAPPPAREPAVSPHRREPASEGLKQRPQQPPSKAPGRPEPAMKPQPARPVQPEPQREQQKGWSPKPGSEGREEGERERQKGLEDLGKERRK